MCQLQPENVAIKSISSNNKDKESMLKKIWPLPTPLVIALIPFLPQPFYLNRGYTVWFHIMSLVYFFTRSPFLRKVLILQGAGICLGWYAAIATDWFVEGTFCHTLYRNMPGSMLPYMVQEVQPSSVDSIESSYVILNTYSSWAMKLVSHILDTLGHPGLAYLFYRLHKKSGGILSDVLTWPVILSAWNFSRVWSLVHSYYNTGEFRFWYFGHDVYVLNNLNVYFIAYVAEGVCFGVAILCRLYLNQFGQLPSLLSLPPMKNGVKESYHEMSSIDKCEGAPMLIHSDSAASASSMM